MARQRDNPLFNGRAPHRRPATDTLLDDWLRDNGISSYALAKAVGIDQRMVAHWRGGKMLPSLVLAFKIERATGGAVPVSSWLGTEVGRLQWGDGVADWEAITDKTNARVRTYARRERAEEKAARAAQAEEATDVPAE